MAINLTGQPDAGGGVLKVPLSDRDHVLGPPDAPLTLVEYGDYQCPHCGKAYAIVEQVRERFAGRLRFAFRHFPLAKMHPKARLAAEAAEEAAAQGKFWAMHGLLFTHQQALDPAHLLEYAKETGLDVDRFRRDLEAHVHANRVQENVSGGVRSGVNGTPTFFINGRRHNGGYELESLVEGLTAADRES